jgi:hypothetical protein
MRTYSNMTVRELEEEIEHIRQVLECKLRMELDQHTSVRVPRSKKEAKRATLLKKYVGKRVTITIAGPYQGKIATVTGPRGKQIEPLYWNLLLADGRKIYKAVTSFKVCAEA